MNQRSIIPAAATKAPHIQVSWGELIDRTTILEIKHERFTDESARNNVRVELERLKPLVRSLIEREDIIAGLKARLRTVNETLWDVENQIRCKEKLASFDDEFIALARSIYGKNDERSAIKRTINDHLECAMREEKSYG